MAHYDDVFLPDRIAFGSRSGPRTSTQKVYVGSGYRKTNRRWSQKLRKFQIGYGVRSPADAYAVQKIFEAVEGPENSFLGKDWSDWNSTDGFMDEATGASMVAFDDQPLKNTTDGSYYGDGSTTTFQMVKRYLVGSASHERTIKKPKNGTVVIGQGGSLLADSNYSVNYSTGIVTFNSAPAAGSPEGEISTWGAEFWTPMAFMDDEFLTELATFDGNSIPDIELEEVRL